MDTHPPRHVRRLLGSRVSTFVDLLGSPVLETTTLRAIKNPTYYAPWGEPQNRTVDGPGYTGHRMDAPTGLIYMQQRYYDPVVGRFLSLDPVAADAGTGGNFNRYPD